MVWLQLQHGPVCSSWKDVCSGQVCIYVRAMRCCVMLCVYCCVLASAGCNMDHTMHRCTAMQGLSHCSINTTVVAETAGSTNPASRCTQHSHAHARALSRYDMCQTYLTYATHQLIECCPCSSATMFQGPATVIAYELAALSWRWGSSIHKKRLRR